jgi:hypothetical protein
MRIANISFLGASEKHDQMVEKKGISNIVSYDMMALPRYREAVQYMSAYIRNEDDQAPEAYKDSDRARKILDYPFMTEKI